MSKLQQQAVELICGLSDDNLIFLIQMIRKIMAQESHTETEADRRNAGIQAFKRLEAARMEIKQYLPDDFDAEKELEEARRERYGDID